MNIDKLSQLYKKRPQTLSRLVFLKVSHFNMWTKFGVAVFLLSGFVAELNAQILTFTINCVFEDLRIHENDGYTCRLSDLEVDFSSPFYFIRVTGAHTEGRTNADVTNVKITNSRINRIPANIFNVFPNTLALEVIDCYNMTFIPPDFYFVDKMIYARIHNNVIPALGGSSFVFATTLEVLFLDNNRINSLAATTFAGLENLRHLSLANNNIRTITPRMLAPLRNLELFIAPDNQLEQLDGRLFINNPELLSVNLVGNNINAIGASFLNINGNLRFLFLERNECASSNFINDDANLNNIRSALGTCFDNSPLGTQITLDVVGDLTILDENDQVLLRIA